MYPEIWTRPFDCLFLCLVIAGWMANGVGLDQSLQNSNYRISGKRCKSCLDAAFCLLSTVLFRRRILFAQASPSCSDAASVCSGLSVLFRRRVLFAQASLSSDTYSMRWSLFVAQLATTYSFNDIFIRLDQIKYWCGKTQCHIYPYKYSHILTL